MKDNPTGKEALSPQDRLLVDEYYELSHRILRLGNRGLPRGEFLRVLFTILLDFSGCDAAEFRLKDGDFNYYAEMLGGPESNFRFGIVNGGYNFVVPEDASGKITATKHNWVPAWESFLAE